MHILTVTNCYPPHYYGGYELTCRDVMDRFEAAGHRITVLTSNVQVPGVTSHFEPHVHRTLSAYWDWNEYRATIPRGPWGRFRIEQKNLAAVRRVLAENPPDLVSVWHMGSLSLSILQELERLELPLVVTVANDWLVYAPTIDGWSRLWQRWPFRWPRSAFGIPTSLPALTDATVNFVSDFTRQRTLASKYWQCPHAAIAHPGVDTRDFPLAPPERRDWRWQLLYVGRIDPSKGVETLLRAFAKLPAEAVLKLVGGGNAGYQADIRRLAQQLGVHDRLTIVRCPRAELAALYRTCDVVVFPSEWDEPFGLVPLEAMTCGMPVVTTIRGGSAEFLQDGLNCVAFESGNVDALVGAVSSLADNPDLRGRLVVNGTSTARHFTIDRYAAQLLELHEAAGVGRRSQRDARH